MTDEKTFPVGYTESIVHEANRYHGRLVSVDSGERAPFSDPKGEKEPCGLFKFRAFSEIGKDGEPVWLTCGEDNLPVFFFYTTGTNYGHPKAKLTTLVNGMVGRDLTKEETKRLNLFRLQNRDCDLLVGEEANENDGGSRNVIKGIYPYNNVPVDASLLLVD